MSLIARLFGSPKAIETMASGIVGGLDKMKFTQEERAEVNLQLGKSVVNWVETSKGQNLSRRLIAVMVSAVWVLGVVLSLIFAVIIPFVSHETAETFNIALAGIKSVFGDFGVSGVFMMVVGFYFAAPHIDKFAGVALKKMSAAK